MIKKSFFILILALPINGSLHLKIRVKWLERTYLIKGLRQWRRRKDRPRVAGNLKNNSIILA